MSCHVVGKSYHYAVKQKAISMFINLRFCNVGYRQMVAEYYFYLCLGIAYITRSFYLWWLKNQNFTQYETED